MQALKRGSGWCHSQGGRAWAVGGVQYAEWLQGRTGKDHQRVRAAGQTRDSYRGSCVAGGKSGEEALLADAYRNSLILAKEHNLESIAFPLISSGAYGYLKGRALKTAMDVIGDFLLKHDMEVYLVVFDKKAFALSEKLFFSITQHIDDRYIEERPVDRTSRQGDPSGLGERYAAAEQQLEYQIHQFQDEAMEAPMEKPLPNRSLEEVINQLDETKDLLLSAGFALSRSSRLDLIVQYFIEEEEYSIFQINEALFAFDQQTLGV